MGVGSEVYAAIVNDRKGIGIELKPSYYRQSLKNVHQAGKDKPEPVELFTDEVSEMSAD
jgi:hypothetical protein